jgi:ubiquinone/menaquinone biosynthesis C-methylase UbiE
MHGVTSLPITFRPTQASKKVSSIAAKYDMDCRSYDALYRSEQDAKLDAAEGVGWSPGGRMVDVGCGTAFLAERLAKPCDLVVGLDISVGMLVRAKRRRRVELVLGDSLYPPFRPKSFSSCVCFTSFHHFRRKPRVVAMMADLVRAGGSVVFSLLTKGEAFGDERYIMRSRRLELRNRLRVRDESLLVMKRL